jgi:hypothetical protein
MEVQNSYRQIVCKTFISKKQNKTKQNKKTHHKNPRVAKKKKIHTKIGKLPFDSDFMDYIFVLWC